MSGTGTEAVEAALAENRATMESVGLDAARIVEAAALVADALDRGCRVLLCGNGGSAADAQHIAAELVGRYLKDRTPWPALALTTDPSVMTAIANDFGFDEVFARQVRAHGGNGDVLLAISTSGESENCLRAVAAAHEAGMKVVTLTGRGGGALASAGDIAINVPAQSTPRIQEAHAFIGHMICQLVEERLCPTA
jgi:D-sedoheptulose 7-phosphate isomerase